MGLSNSNSGTGFKGFERVQWAKWFIERGFAVFPIDPDTKKPAVKEWTKYSTTPLTEEEKKRYLEMIEKGYNYAIPGGQNGLVVLDFESKDLLKEWIGEDELNKLCASTFCDGTTHGGLHVYVIADEPPPKKFSPLFEQGGKRVADLQSFNSYVLGPGSCINHKFCETDKCPWKGQDHVTCYVPINNKEIAKITDLKGFLKFLADSGKKLGIELGTSAKIWIKGGYEETLKNLKEELKRYDSGKSIEKIKEEICSKAKNEVVRKAICEGKTYSEIGIDRSRGDWKLIIYLMKHGVTDPDKILQFLPVDSKAKNNEKWQAEKYFTLTLSEAWKIAKKYIELKKNLRRADKVSEIRAEIQETISEIIRKKYKIRTFYQTTGSGESVVGTFRWNKKTGTYEEFDVRLRKIVRKEIEFAMSLFESDSDDEERKIRLVKVFSGLVDSVINEIRDMTLTPYPPDPLRIAFPNATIEWKNNGSIDLYEDRTAKDEHLYSFHYVPHKINTEELKKFHQEIAQKGGEITVEDIEQLAQRLCPTALEVFKQWVGDKWITLFEIIGYVLYPGLKFKKAFMMLGPRDSGKTTFINMVVDLIGKDNAQAEPLAKLFNPYNRFEEHLLFHKLVNATTETTKYSIDDIDRFKRLTGGDPITADRKFKDPITFRPYAKLIVASNFLPYVDPRLRKDEAFWRRWMIVEFPNKFPNDDTWYDRTINEKEKEGILTVAIVAFLRVIRQGHFDYEQTPREVMGYWLSDIDSVYKFIVTYVRKGILKLDPRNGDLWVERKKLYDMYREFCLDIGETAVGKKTFTRLLREYFGITVAQKGPEKKRVFVGVTINELAKAVSEQEYTGTKILEEFIEYVKKNNGVSKEFTEIVMDFGDQAKANRFITWCLWKNHCRQRGIDTFEIHI
jgi:putative DNA primase/helicase